LVTYKTGTIKGQVHHLSFLFSEEKPMPISYVSGDPMLTEAQTLVFGHNAKARTEVGKFEMRLFNLYPAAFATYRKQCVSGRVKPGGIWIWRESKPFLAFMVIRETSVGATRSRYVESGLLTLARDYHLYGLTSLAIAPLGAKEEWVMFRPLLDYWLRACPLSITVYE
jgi:hypothetical protein